jgi:DASH complex subunit DAD3
MDNSTKIRQTTNKLEAEVLDEYARMVELLDRVCPSLIPTNHSTTGEKLMLKIMNDVPIQMSDSAHELSTLPPYLLEGLLPLERKMGLVLTLFKASVWSVLVQKQRESENRQRS